MHKKLASLILSGLISVSVVGCGNNEVEELETKVTKLEEENTQLEANNKELETKNTQLEIKNKQLEGQNTQLQEKVDEASPWFEMKEEERKAEQERIAKEKAEKEEAERKAKEEAEAKAKAEQEAKEKAEKEEAERKEKQGYETGITYSQLARTPDDYKGEKCKFKGKVVQVMEEESIVAMRLAVNGSYDNILYVMTTSKTLNGERILEDDYITVYGTSSGIYTYTTVMGASVSIPSMLVTKIDR